MINYQFLFYFARLEFMVAKIKDDMDKLDKQLGDAETSVESATVPALKSIVPAFIFVSTYKITSCFSQINLC
jgi:hypothetical protein